MQRPRPPVVLAISGSDPSGGAGLEADLKTLQAHGIYGMALPTLWTVQNTLGVQKVRWADPDFLAAQWRALFADIRPDAIKIGALGSRNMVRRIAALLRSPVARGIPVVLDPVLHSTSGASLLERGAEQDLALRIFPLCRVITPNAPEFSTLCGATVSSQNAPELLRGFAAGKPYAVFLKGGHLGGSESDDLLFEAGRLYRLRGPRLRGASAHGTGCALASAIAARLAGGESLTAACRRAKAFVARAIETAPPLGHGRRLLNLSVKTVLVSSQPAPR